MSILLDALRKSENSRRQIEINALGPDTSTDPESGSLQMGSLALLLVTALFFSGWFVWRQYQLPAGSYQPPVTLSADKTQPVNKPPATVEPRASANTGAAAPSAAGDRNAVVENRTPVESYQEATTKPVEAKVKATKPVVPVSGTTKPVVSAPEKQLPAKPEPIGYWELPDAVRANVPEMKFSVLVYATNPNERFALIGGRRLKEGDSYRPGLVVNEIRRDGVIFSYRLYQFLVKR